MGPVGPGSTKEVLVSSNSVIGWVGELLAFEELLSYPAKISTVKEAEP